MSQSFQQAYTAIIGLIVLIVLSFNSFAEESDKGATPSTETKEESPVGVGPDKGVTEVSKEMGIRLSEKAIGGLGIKTIPISFSKGDPGVPPSSLLSFQEGQGFYRLRDNWFKLIEIKSVNSKMPHAKPENIFPKSETRPGDQVVTKGAELLRLTELNVWGGSEGGE